MCEFHKSTCNGFGHIWWTDNPIYFSSIDIPDTAVFTDACNTAAGGYYEGDWFYCNWSVDCPDI